MKRVYPDVLQHVLNFVHSIKHIAKKSHQEICIYYENNDSKTIKRSSEIKQNCHISACLKQNIEQWLQLALEYDAKKRGVTTTQCTIFEELRNILDKKIVTVFSVYTYDFYYYEVNEYTLVSTLKDWIIRDTKIPKYDLILLTKNESDVTTDDEQTVLTTLGDVSTNWCVIFIFT